MSGGRRAVFLDRDSTLIVDRHYLADPDGVELLPGVGEGLARLAASGFALVVTTNQSGVARGLFDENAVVAVNQRLEDLLRARGVALDGVYWCPHLEGGAVARYAIACGCRKPKLGMLERAAAELGLELAGSFAIGDRPSDVERTGEIGVRGILLGSGPAPSPAIALAPTFADAVELVLRASQDRGNFVRM
jgi:D-glycero-D-manno-heptose 1,7-bisphosphate phosphatase